mmetsp:Transcript_16466/g.41787  ORF Transcript_16466/g.41787 Transcript_16466/m.41787 type:complete len:251 (+) Transcript_16466:131-883(+)
MGHLPFRCPASRTSELVVRRPGGADFPPPRAVTHINLDALRHGSVALVDGDEGGAHGGVEGAALPGRDVGQPLHLLLAVHRRGDVVQLGGGIRADVVKRDGQTGGRGRLGHLVAPPGRDRRAHVVEGAVPADGAVVQEDARVVAPLHGDAALVVALGALVQQHLAGVEVHRRQHALRTLDLDRVRLVQGAVDVEDAGDDVRLDDVQVVVQRLPVLVHAHAVHLGGLHRDAGPLGEYRHELVVHLVVEIRL